MIVTEEEKQELVDAAWASIRSGLMLGGLPRQKHSALSRNGASFVTLHCNRELRGCIGTLEAHQPLFTDVVQNAGRAAFHDPRFPPLQAGELNGLSLSVSVLSEFHEMAFSSEQELLSQLVPGETGLVLIQGNRRATFLPSVWEMLPDPADFVRRLKAKGGLPFDAPTDFRALSYTTTSFS